MADDWGVPDWLDAGAYPAVDGMTIREWWWEFTRRRPDYRAMWNAADEIEDKSHRYAPDVDAFRLKFKLSVIHDPRLQFTDWDLMHFRYPVNGFIQERNDDAAMREAQFIIDNRDRLPHNFLDAEIERRKARRISEKEAGIRHYVFDLSEPLDPQITKAGQELKHLQAELFGKKQRRKLDEFWPTYLRVVDARDAGATYEEIREQFWPDDDKKLFTASRDTYKAACRVRDNFPI